MRPKQPDAAAKTGDPKAKASTRASVGARAEALACEYLQKQGLEVLAKNWRSRFGELDLVLRESGTIVFVEVRLRTHTGFGTPGESIDRRKRDRLLATARLFLSRYPGAHCRFDAVLLTRLDPPKIEWIRDAISE